MSAFAQNYLPILKKIYYYILIFFSVTFFGISVILTNLVWTVISLVGLFALIWIGKKCDIDYSWTQKKWVPYMIYGASFLLRAIYCCMMLPYISQVSDFKIVVDEAASGNFIDCLEYYRFYFHKFFYPYILNGLSINTQAKILIFQCVIVSFIPVLLFYIGKKIINTTVGFWAAIVYICMPSLIVYTQITTEEHISALVTPAIVYIIICIHEQIESITAWNKSMLLIAAKAFGVGILCGVASYSKDWALIIFVASAICAFYQILKGNRYQLATILIAVVLLFAGRSAFNSYIKGVGEQILGVSPNNGVITLQMFSSLDPNSNGEYNVELNAQYMQIATENNYDFDKTNSIANGILKEKIKKDYKKMPAMLLHKAQTAYRANETIFGWALDKEVNDEFKDRCSVLIKLIKKIDQLIYVLCFVLIIISIFINKNKYIYFIQLIILGSAFVNLIVECQQRYKYSIISLWCIPIAYAAVWIVNKSKGDKSSDALEEQK